MLVTLEKISKGFGAHEVLENISARIDDNGRIGLIGANGAGKSTLLNIIIGDLEPDKGSVYHGNGKRFGFLRQNSGLKMGNSIKEEMESVFSHLFELEEKMRTDEKAMSKLDPATAEYKKIATRYADSQNEFELGEGYKINAKIASMLNGMGFKGTDWETSVDVLSGGEKARLAICKLLLEEPDLLIMDEPTNHLDFPTLLWLENYLAEYKGALLLVSHDRFFLDRLCTTIWEIQHHEMETYKGNYTKYLAQKQERYDFRMREYEKQQEEIAELKDFVARNMARASTTKRAQSRQNILDRMEVLSRPKIPPAPPKIRFKVKRNPVNDVLILEDLALSVGEAENRVELFKNLNLHIRRGEKLALVGRNGIGKSSMLKAVRKKIPIDEGKIIWGRNTDVAYFEQGEGEMDAKKTVIYELWDDFPRENEHTIRSTLGAAGLVGDEVYKQVGALSGGERARLKFAKLMLKEGNVLLLDEPTNHLDLPTKEVLDKALEEFEGTLLVVSHDRYLLNKFPDKIIEMHEDGAVIYEGNYDYYAEKKAAEKALEEGKTEAAEEEKAKAQKEQKAASSYRTKEQRREAAQRRLRLGELEEEVLKLETSIETLEYEITLPEVMSDYIELEEKCGLMEEAKVKLNIALEEWAALSEEEENC